MKLVRMRLCNFQSFGTETTEINFVDMTFVLGPNGTGKTAALEALARMFSLDPALRKIRPSDFHVPHEEVDDDAPEERELWIEAQFEFPELNAEDADQDDLPAVPGNFAHMQLETAEGPAQVRFRLEAKIDQENDIEETFTYVVSEDDDGSPAEQSSVPRQDRNAIQLHYLPARRDPSDHISYSANTLLGRLLRSADWSEERDEINRLTEQISDSLGDNDAIASITEALTEHWGDMHTGSYFADPAVSFARSEIENLLRHMSIRFTPGHGEAIVDFSRLSDGQQSLLYVSLVLAAHEIGSKVLSGELQAAFSVEKLRPSVFTLIAVEEPENSLSPHYLGRLTKSLKEFAEGRDSQAIVATHSPSLLRRIDPESIRYLRLDEGRRTVVKHIQLPRNDSAQKYIREGVQAFPELYFSRLVVLGEGDSEVIVLPRVLTAQGILSDDASISVVPLGGRHVNHLWRLLHELGIPHVTLLDLDLARHQGGWGRIKYAAKKLLLYSDTTDCDITQEEIETIPAWDSEEGLLIDDDGWVARLEEFGVFFSSPLDLDFMMMEAFPEAFKLSDDDKEEPDEVTMKSVLGKNHDTADGQYSDDQLLLFDAYHAKFKLGSKPTWHIRALASIEDDDLINGLPQPLRRMLTKVQSELEDLPE